MIRKLRQLDQIKDKYIEENQKSRCDENAARSERDLVGWISTSMRLSGHKLVYKDVENVMSGAGIVSGTIEEYLIIQRYVELMKQFKYMVEMNTEIDSKYLSLIYMTLSGTKTARVRTSNGSSFLGYGFYPADPREIKRKIGELMSQLSDTYFSSEPVLKAVFLHNSILEIQPFEAKNEAVAYASLSYELLRAGFPLLTLEITHDQYMDYMKKSIVNEDIEGFVNLVINTLAIKMQKEISKNT